MALSWDDVSDASGDGGLVQAGNIDLSKRPRVKNKDGTVSTVRSIGVNVDGVEVLIPTVSDDGRIMSDDEAVKTFKRTGKHLGIFDSPEASTAFAERLHENEAAKLATPAGDDWDSVSSAAPELPAGVRASETDRGVMLTTAEPETKSVGRHVAEGAGALWENWNPVAMARGVKQILTTNPADTASALAGNEGVRLEQDPSTGAFVEVREPAMTSAGQWQRAGEAFDRGVGAVERARARGDWNTVTPESVGAASEAILHGAAAMVPLVGPAIASAGEQIGQGNWGRGVGEALGFITAPKVGAAYVRGATGALRKAAAPLAGKVNPAVAAAAERTGVEMPASALSDSKVVPLAESLAAKGPGGGAAASRFTNAMSHLTARAEQLAAHASKYADESQIGRVVADGFNSYKAAWEQTKNALYKPIDIPTKIKFFTRADDAVSFIDDVLAEKRAGSRHVGVPAPEEVALTRLRDALTRDVKGKRVPKDIQARDLRALKRQFVDPHTDFKAPVATGDAAVYRKLGAMLDDQVDTAIQKADPGLFAKIEAAKTVYKDGLHKIDSTYGQTIKNLADAEQFDKIAQSIVKAQTSADDLPRIFQVVGPEGTSALRTSVLADLVSSAKKGGEAMTPKGLATAMAKYGDDKLAAILTKEQFATLKDLRTLSTAMEKGTKVMSGSQTAYIGRIASYPAALLADPATALTMLAGDAAASRFIGSRFGQRWMTTGFRPLSSGVTNTVAKVAERTARPAATIERMPRPKPKPVYPQAAEENEDDFNNWRVAAR